MHHNDTCNLIFASGTILQRLAADFQNDTTLGGEEGRHGATPAAGGLLVYSKTLSIPFGVPTLHFPLKAMPQRVGSADAGVHHRFIE